MKRNKVIKRLSCLLMISILVVMTACGKEVETTEIPEEFRFTYVWGTYGISSYDSTTGKLVKTTDATIPEDYVTTVFLDETMLIEIYELLRDLDLESYPDTYDPINAPDAELRIMSQPSRTVILTIQMDGVSKTVMCSDIAYKREGYDKKSQAFLDACARIEEILTATKEWQELPEYEHFYQ